MQTPVKTLINRMLAIAFIAVLLIFVFIRPTWKARLIAETTFFLIGNFILLFYGFHTRSDFLGKGKISRTGSGRTRKNAQIVIRATVILFSVFFGWNVTAPVAEDAYGIISQGHTYLKEVKGEVGPVDFFWGMFFIKYDVIVYKNGQKPGNGYSALLFPRFPIEGNTYWFLIAPKSEMILDWQSSNSNESAPNWK